VLSIDSNFTIRQTKSFGSLKPSEDAQAQTTPLRSASGAGECAAPLNPQSKGIKKDASAKKRLFKISHLRYFRAGSCHPQSQLLAGGRFGIYNFHNFSARVQKQVILPDGQFQHRISGYYSLFFLLF
jgi:hypothetical protein